MRKPLLAFQQANLAFEMTLIGSGMRYSIVRPTAFFKWLSGQIERVCPRRPFLIFGDGRLTACRPISNADLADYIVGCLEDKTAGTAYCRSAAGRGDHAPPAGRGAVALLKRTPGFRSVPFALLCGVIGGFGALAGIPPSFAAKSELARIGLYYATESMLVLDSRCGRHDAAATPSTGTETLFDFYRAELASAAALRRGELVVF